MLSTSESLGGGLTPGQLISTLYDDLIISKESPDALQRVLQKYYLERLMALLEDDNVSGEIKGLAYGQLMDAKKLMAKKGKSGGNLAAHYKYCAYMIDLE